MKNLLKNFVTIISVFLLAVIHFVSPASAKNLVIMTSLPSMEFPFFVHMQKQLDQEARRIGGIKIMAADGQNRVPKQTADVESAIIQGVDGIIISPIDVNAMAPALQQAIDAGIEEFILVTRSGKEAIENHFDVNYELERRLELSGKKKIFIPQKRRQVQRHVLRSWDPNWRCSQYIGFHPHRIGKGLWLLGQIQGFLLRPERHERGSLPPQELLFGRT